MKSKKREVIQPKNIRQIPLLNIRIMTDDEWNRLAYQNYIERQAKEDGEQKKFY